MQYFYHKQTLPRAGRGIGVAGRDGLPLALRGRRAGVRDALPSSHKKKGNCRLPFFLWSVCRDSNPGPAD